MPNYYHNMQDYSCRNNGGCSGGRSGYTRNGSGYAMQQNMRYDSNRASEEHFREKERRGNGPSCAVCANEDAISGMPLAMAYVPWQKWEKLYEIDKGFCAGTIFRELDKPFEGKGGRF